MHRYPQGLLIHAKEMWQGLIICVIVGLSASYLSDHYGGASLLYALLLGVSLNFLSSHNSLAPGIEFTSRTLLRLGVALLGARITLGQIGSLGWGVVLVVVLGIAFTFIVALLLAKISRRPMHEGLISGGSVAICGASAALAVYAVLPQTRENEKFALFTIMSVTVMSSCAMIVYPLVLAHVDLVGVKAGIVLGASIHDVAQVVAAGSFFGSEARDTATIVKLFRVAMLAPIIFLILLMRRSEDTINRASRVVAIPSFLLGFLFLVILGTLNIIPDSLKSFSADASHFLLLIAIAGASMRTKFEDLVSTGFRPLVLLLVESILLFLLVVCLVKLI